ncbi:MAG: hypothetical protein ACT4PV_05340 [Planctomycetaceae bacterium]
MIAVAGPLLAHLGGWRGDLLSLARDGEGLRPVAELGWDGRAQVTPQRRLALTEEALFVLEPVSGPLLAPPLRVRRFDPRTGAERGREDGRGEEGEAGEAGDYFNLERREAGRIHALRCGIDRGTGRPLVWEGPLPDLGQLAREPHCSGTPLLSRGTCWYPLRVEGLLRIGGPGDAFWRGDAGPPLALSGEALVVGVRRGASGLWREGVWRRFPAGTPRLWPPYRAPLSGAAAPWAGGIVALVRGGGLLPTLDAPAPPPRLPPGLYSGLAALPSGLVAVEDGATPRLVPVVLTA